MRGATAVENSKNSKIGLMSATSVSQVSCSDGCKLKKYVVVPVGKPTKKLCKISYQRACYANHGTQAWTTNRLNKEAAAENLTPLELAREEAAAILTLTGKNWLRIHVVGDCMTDEAALIVSSAAAAHKSKHGQGAHSYTHVWRSVKRESWQEVSVLASCESFDEAKQAMVLGWAPAVVLTEKHSSPKAYKVDGMNVIPCPQQTGKSKDCLACGLCLNDAKLRAMKAVIAFEPDDQTEKAVNQSLIQITQLQ
jgi:hypothetical protein